MSTVTERSPRRSAPRRRTVRQRLAAVVLGVVTLAGAGVAAAAPASAAGPSSLPSYGYSTDVPTWFWGSTTLCVQNQDANRTGVVRVASRTGAAAEYMYIAPRRSTCIERWWWGVPVTATNVSHAPLVAWSY